MKMTEYARDILNEVVEAVFPRRERRIRAETRTPESIALFPETHALLGHEIVTLMHYEDAKDLIQALKYDRSEKTAYALALVLADYLREEIISHRQFSQSPVLLIPVPLHENRRANRGYNQIGIVLDSLPEEFKNGRLSRIAAPVLERTRDTKAQTRLSRQERLSNVADAFTVSDPDLVHGSKIFLIDDVATTGATLVHAGKALKDAGADVVRVALARA